MTPRDDDTRVSRTLVDMPVASTGRFRIYLGLAAGVGKTYAMLDEAHRRRQRGSDVVVAVVNTHGRPLTAARLEGLESVPLASVAYRGSTFHEMDLAAVLARRPEVALVDELAHTNVPGSGQGEKRWQDVLELLAANIGVISTINIQHVESLADVVERLTGAPVRERVPDEVLLRADQIELVDSSPEQLRRRMVHGNIYPPERAARALAGFFRTDTLTALRELTLRFLADEIDDELIERLVGTGTASWEASERVLVGVGPGPEAAGVLRRAARIAARLKADLYAVHVGLPDSSPATPDGTVAELHALTDHLGAYWHELEGDVAESLIQFATEHHITQIVIGHSGRSRWWQPLRGGVARRLTRHAEAAAIDLHIVTRDPVDAAATSRGD
jgi:two-component system sensor histidine kinase KdpD